MEEFSCCCIITPLSKKSWHQYRSKALMGHFSDTKRLLQRFTWTFRYKFLVVQNAFKDSENTTWFMQDSAWPHRNAKHPISSKNISMIVLFLWIIQSIREAAWTTFLFAVFYFLWLFYGRGGTWKTRCITKIRTFLQRWNRASLLHEIAFKLCVDRGFCYTFVVPQNKSIENIAIYFYEFLTTCLYSLY